MNGKFISFLSRLFFFAAMFVLLIAMIDFVMRLFGWTFSWVSYAPGRVFEFAAILMVVVVVLLLRQIRELLKK